MESNLEEFKLKFNGTKFRQMEDSEFPFNIYVEPNYNVSADDDCYDNDDDCYDNEDRYVWWEAQVNINGLKYTAIIFPTEDVYELSFTNMILTNITIFSRHMLRRESTEYYLIKNYETKNIPKEMI